MAGALTNMGFLEPSSCDTKPWIIDPNIRVFISMSGSVTQRQIALDVLAERGMVRLAELRNAGVTAATMSRMERDREVIRLARGLYQLPDAELDVNHSLAEAAKRSPKAVICLVSALAFHGLTDQLPRQVWLAIGSKDWAPKPDDMPIRIVRFTQTLLNESIEIHTVEGVPVKIFGVAKTIADCFRYRNKIGLSVAIEGLQEALRKRSATPGEIANQAVRGGVGTVIRPYLEALTVNG
jgi:predicted transcriptional regulator of viral defense system